MTKAIIGMAVAFACLAGSARADEIKLTCGTRADFDAAVASVGVQKSKEVEYNKDVTKIWLHDFNDAEPKTSFTADTLISADLGDDAGYALALVTGDHVCMLPKAAPKLLFDKDIAAAKAAAGTGT